MMKDKRTITIKFRVNHDEKMCFDLDKLWTQVLAIMAQFSKLKS